jgi:hypothetical protein
LLSLAKAGKEKKGCCFGYLCHTEGKKVKVLTHQQRYIETAKVLKLAEGPSSAVEPEYPALAEDMGESAEVPRWLKLRNVLSKIGKTVEEPELKKPAGQPKTLSPPQKPAITPKRRRMASTLDAFIEPAKVQIPASTLDRGRYSREI